MALVDTLYETSNEAVRRELDFPDDLTRRPWVDRRRIAGEADVTSESAVRYKLFEDLLQSWLDASLALRDEGYLGALEWPDLVIEYRQRLAAYRRAERQEVGT